MIIALFALALAMIIGGIASVVQGFPFVRLESGLAMTIAGAATASAGAVLLGVAVLAGQVRALARRLAATGTIAVPPTAEVPLPPAETFDADRGETAREPAGRRPLLAGTAGLAAGAAGAAYLGGAVRERPEPSFAEETTASDYPAAPEPLFPELRAMDLTHPGDFEPSLAMPIEELPNPPLAYEAESHAAIAAEPAFHAEPAPAQELEADADLFALPEPEAQVAEAPVVPSPEIPSHDVPPADLSSPDIEPQQNPQPDSPHAEEPALRPAIEDAPIPTDAPALDVVGTYVSGGNTYVMFSDGSIEADTPRGRFTFDSLDELKAFVDAGGEGGTRGAA